MITGELKNISGKPVFTVQQYEQKQKNINKANSEHLLRLSLVLKCSMDTLREMKDLY